MLVAKSGYLRRKIMESDQSGGITAIDLSDVPGGAETFEKVAKFCYGVNFEITINNVAALRCAAEFLEMEEMFFEGNLAARAEEFLKRAALKSIPSTVAVLNSCEPILAIAEHLHVVQRCVDALAMKVCIESKFPSRSPESWWAYELASLSPAILKRTLAAAQARGADNETVVVAVCAYAEKKLPEILAGKPPPATEEARRHVSAIVSLLPATSALHVGFLCCLLRAAVFLHAPESCRGELERRVSDRLDQATVNDLLTVALDYGGDRVADLGAVRRVVAGFVEREAHGGAIYGGAGAMQQVAKTVDGFVGEIAADENVTVGEFSAVAGVIPKTARQFDDDLYRAVDIYLKAHPGLGEAERESVCSVMDPLKLSYEARIHAAQNKRLPLKITLHAIYYDELNLRSGEGGVGEVRKQVMADSALIKENEALKSELSKMKTYVSDIKKAQLGGGGRGTKKPTLLASFSKTLVKLNPFRQEFKDTSHLDGTASPAKPRRRRFSIS
ncbi:root phototropism protein 2-like isoform X2 [Wolffia australiana]